MAGNTRRRLSVGPYQILERITCGRLAGLFHARARHTQGSRLLATGQPQRHAGRDQQANAAFAAQARVSVQLNHPNIVRLFQVGKVGSLYFLAFEPLHGSSLLDLLDANSVMDTGADSFAIDLWDLSPARRTPRSSAG